MAKITVKDTEVTVIKIDNEDYICITDMIKAKDGDFFVSDWLRNRNTLEYIGIWEQVYNPSFNYSEFALIKSQAGLNSFKISVKEWVNKTKQSVFVPLQVAMEVHMHTKTLLLSLACGLARNSKFISLKSLND